MVVFLAYVAVAAAFYLACARELRRARSRERLPRDAADHFILHLVAVLAALLWVGALPVLAWAGVKRLRPRQTLARTLAWSRARLPHRRVRLAEGERVNG